MELIPLSNTGERTIDNSCLGTDKNEEITSEIGVCTNKLNFAVHVIDIPKLDDNHLDKNSQFSALLKNTEEINFGLFNPNEEKELNQTDNEQSELSSYVSNNHLEKYKEKKEIMTSYTPSQKDEKKNVKENEVTNKLTKFRIIKVSKNGRKRLKFNKKYYEHTKYLTDNTQKIIMVQFSKFIVEFTNGILKGNMFRPSINNLKFRKIAYPKRYRTIFTKKIKEILQRKENGKYSGKRNKNKKAFMQLMKRKGIINNQNFFTILEYSVEYFYSVIYLSENYEMIIEKYTINRKNKNQIIFFQEFLENMKNKGKDLAYIEKLKTDAKNLSRKNKSFTKN